MGYFYMRKVFIRISICLFIVLFVCLGFKKNDVIAVDNKTEIDEAYYRVESSQNETLQYGLEYHKDQAYSLIKDEKFKIGNVCGGATYSNTPLELNKEYTQEAHVLKIGKNSDVKIVSWSIIKNGKWELSNIIATAKDYEKNHPGYKVIAGINADFFDISASENYPHAVQGMMASDGENLRINDYTGWQALRLDNTEENKPLLKSDNPKASDKKLANKVYPNIADEFFASIVYFLSILGINI